MSDFIDEYGVVVFLLVICFVIIVFEYKDTERKENIIDFYKYSESFEEFSKCIELNNKYYCTNEAFYEK